MFAEPEVDQRELRAEDEYLHISSDGVTEFLTDKEVLGMIKEFPDPLKAAEKIVDKSYQLWMEMDFRTDDITTICVHMKKGETGGFPQKESRTSKVEKADPPVKQSTTAKQERPGLLRRGSLHMSYTGGIESEETPSTEV